MTPLPGGFNYRVLTITMTLDQLLDIWYQSDTDYFDTMLAANDSTLVDMAKRQIYMCLDDGVPFTAAFDAFDDSVFFGLSSFAF